MKCPNCGSEMAEGSLYCENCGEDIHIVPDFEPELELDIEQTLNNIIEDIHEDLKQIPKKKKLRKRKKRVWIAVLAVFAVFVLTAAGLAVGYAYSYYSEEYQITKASRYVEAGEYDKAIACYSRALELQEGDISLLFELADVYYLKNNKIEYEYILRSIIKNKNATSEQLESAYGKLIAIYRDKKDYQTINDLLLASENATLISTYRNYIAEDPVFSINGGYYSEIQPLKLSAVGNGKIYYTMDGRDPTEASSQYTAPIILENGKYIIKAYFVNEYGISSNIITHEYNIENDEIFAPEVSLMGGDYCFPLNIEILGDDEDVYYTTDGSDPTYSSFAYTGPIPMPLGKSHYKFAKIVDGVTGTIAERKYNLVMNTDFTPQEAVALVVEYALNSGKIYDKEGFFDDSGDAYCYEYQYVSNINSVDDFYVVAEIYRTAGGALTKTGNNFAVNAYTKELYKLRQDDAQDGVYLVLIQQNDSESE